MISERKIATQGVVKSFISKAVRAFALTMALSVPATAVAVEVSVVDRPEFGANSHYTSFRAPLRSTPLMKLPVGDVQPEGWLREIIVRQSEGLCGQLGTISAWLDKNNNQWLSDHGSHGWEEVPYWLRGYCSMAYILDDEAMKQEAQTWFEGVFANLKEDGFLGPRNTDNGRPEIWAQMIMLWAMQTYYEYSNDPRVIEAMTNYVNWELALPDDQMLEGLWEHQRGGDNMWSVLWLYNITGNEALLPAIEKLHNNTSNWLQKGTLPNWHGVNFAQGFREPAMYYMYTGDVEHLKAAYNNHNEMRARYGQVPGGMYGADENARTGYFDPRQGTETCALVEQMASDEIMMQITGDIFWADHCEQVALNQFTASMMPDMRSLRYLTAPNMTVSDEKLHGPSIDNNLRGMLSMSPFSSRCCQHNHGMGWPYYAERLIMATADNGLAAMLFAPNTTTAKVAGGKEVKIVETTHYPFEGEIEFAITTDEAVAFPFYLRVPQWADGASVKVNGAEVAADVKGGNYVRLSNEWSNGDKVTLSLPMNVTTDRWAQNKGSLSVNYGPLTLSLLIDEKYEQHDSRDHNFVQDDSHWQEGVDASLWPCYTIAAEGPWNYALAIDDQKMPVGFSVEKREWPADNYPFTLESVPLRFTAVGYRIPAWGLDATGMTDLLPTKYEQREAEPTPLVLVPMGAARLRLSAFPPR